MPPIYHNVEKVAEILGVTPDEVKAMRERGELHGYRDGANWKFKADDVDKFVAKRSEDAGGGDDDLGDLLLSEVELGQADAGTSGTVLKMDDDRAASSDIQLSDASDKALAGNSDIALADDLSQADTSVTMEKPKTGSDSTVDLSSKAEDDDMVLGGSGSGSDIAIGGDSGIMLVDPSDSGLSLEEPIALSGGSDESLELGEDDMITLADEPASLSAPTVLKSSEDFELTPLHEPAEEADDESGSQVIALDTDLGLEAAAAPGGAAAMLEEEDVSTDLGMGMAAAGVAGAAALAGEPATVVVEQALPERPWSAIDILLLIPCVAMLVISGMLMYDVLRNMYSWEGFWSVNSPLMSMLTSLIEG